MTDKEFKRLNRAQLIEIIYKLQLQVDQLTEEKRELRRALADKRLRIEKVGNLAEAALEINNCFVNAQRAAEHYLSEIQEMYKETAIQQDKIIADARAEADEIIASAKKASGFCDPVTEAMIKESVSALEDNG